MISRSDLLHLQTELLPTDARSNATTANVAEEALRAPVARCAHCRPVFGSINADAQALCAILERVAVASEAQWRLFLRAAVALSDKIGAQAKRGGSLPPTV